MIVAGQRLPIAIATKPVDFRRGHDGLGDWRKLLPVCDFAEAHGIPVEMANENLPIVWRTREMQGFIGGPLCQGSCPLLYFSSISQVGGIG